MNPGRDPCAKGRIETGSPNSEKSAELTAEYSDSCFSSHQEEVVLPTLPAISTSQRLWLSPWSSNETVEKLKFAPTLLNPVHQNTSTGSRSTILGHPLKPFFSTILTVVRLLTFSTVSTTSGEWRQAVWHQIINSCQSGCRPVECGVRPQCYFNTDLILLPKLLTLIDCHIFVLRILFIYLFGDE